MVVVVRLTVVVVRTGTAVVVVVVAGVTVVVVIGAGAVVVVVVVVTEGATVTCLACGEVAEQAPASTNVTTATAREMLQLHGRLYHLPPQRIDEQIAKLLKLVELEKVADRYTGTCSGGMRRRFDLALSLIHEPKVLFLDEPTQGLDPHARQLIWAHLRELNAQGMTIFLTTHFMDEAETLCQRIAIMDQGKIVVEGTIDELLKAHSAKSLEEVFLKLTEEESNVSVAP